jgi:hypothetical protein
MNNLLNGSAKFLKRNSSTILTCLGAVGVVATTVMSVKATPKATAALEAKKEEKGDDLTALETITAVAPSYAPSVVTGIATIGCIFGINVLNKRNQASLMSAYALLDKSYKQHKDKVKELFGEQGAFQVKESIAKDHYEEQESTLTGEGELFYDFYSDRYFESTMDKVKQAEYELNRMINVEGGAYLNDFYKLVGLDAIEGGDIVGWSVGLCFEQYWQPWVDFSHEYTTMDTDSTRYADMDCCIITFLQDPVPNFEDY